jgi:hypothetical protein
MCPRFGMPPLPKPGDERGAARRAPRRQRSPLFPSSDDEDAGGADSPADSGDNANTCHKCHGTGSLLCCDGEGCTHAYHARCLPTDAMSPDSDTWLCPVCAGSDEPAGFVGNPQQPPHRGSRTRARKRPLSEPSKPRVAAAKKARRPKAGTRYR